MPNSYLPPNQNSPPSSQYLPPSTNYGVPSTALASPVRGPTTFQPRPSSNYGAPSFNQQPQRPSSQYGAPSGPSAPSQQYGAPSYDAPSAPSQQYGAPSNSYQQQSPVPSYPSAAPLQTSYGPPSSGYADTGSNGYSNGGYENAGEPAKYNFEYAVQDYQSGNDFGHMESRDGDKTVGRYYVLLPDGRKQVRRGGLTGLILIINNKLFPTQIVTYEADKNGYRPTITYEETNQGQNGNQGGQGGYSNSNGYNNNGQFNGY